MGCGTWSWGNRILWDYDPSQDEEIYQAYKLVRKAGITVFDTADSYGTGNLNGRAEILLGQFERRYQQELLLMGGDRDGDDLKSRAAAASKPWWDLSGGSSNKDSKQQQQRLLLAPDQQQQIATKFAPYPWRLTRGSFCKAAQESLARIDYPPTRSRPTTCHCTSTLVHQKLLTSTRGGSVGRIGGLLPCRFDTSCGGEQLRSQTIAES